MAIQKYIVLCSLATLASTVSFSLAMDRQDESTTTESSKGWLEIYCGPMFAGKTEKLIHILLAAQHAHKDICAFKHIFDNKRAREDITSHNRTTFPAVATGDPLFILHAVTPHTQIVAIDEVQFFHPEILGVIQQLINNGKRVIVTALDLNFAGSPFGYVPLLLALAKKATKLTAICSCCGKEATHSQRIINGKPANFGDPIIMIGAEECYEPRCAGCFEIDRVADWTELAKIYTKE